MTLNLGLFCDSYSFRLGLKGNFANVQLRVVAGLAMSECKMGQKGSSSMRNTVLGSIGILSLGCMRSECYVGAIVRLIGRIIRHCAAQIDSMDLCLTFD